MSRNIPPDVIETQRQAADPDVSAWVGANAGSGKTHVLAQRVINLLLKGNDPAKILCITFTKAAAANMANRVFGTLARWVTLDDAELDTEIRATSNAPVNDATRALARRLFAAALETPGGLKVQTIHAFCTRVLHQFPFEANVAARFTVLDDASTAQTLDRLTLEVLLEAAAQPDSPLGRALEKAIIAAADQTVKDAINDAIREREFLSEWIGRAGSIDAAVAELCAALDVPPDLTDEAVRDAFVTQALIPPDEWPHLAAVFAEGRDTDREKADALTAALTASPDGKIELYQSVFCTGDLKPRKSLITKDLGNANPAWAERLSKEQNRVCRLIALRHAVSARDRTAALMTISMEVIARYQAEKNRRGLLDYDDLIGKTIALFRHSSPTWVLYKLDAGINHLLVDEAQDISPRQWEIVRAIADEFTAGAGARSVRRTLFAVGDEKQSIFSFQGAAPDTFADMRAYFERRHRDTDGAFRPLEFKTSFRSGPVVLDAVDIVFKRPEAHDGLNAVAEATAHRALPDAAPGEVEIWELIKGEKIDKSKAWNAPFDDVTANSPGGRLASAIAAEVRRHIEAGGRPGDVLVLVRQRSALFDAIIRALKDAGIAVAGADRLVLTEHIAVMDLMTLADALLLPDDDLALATVLKSPLFGLDEQGLLDLAWGRKGSLRDALRTKAKSEKRFAGIQALLERYAALARDESPFGFYARLLGAEGGRKNITARLGYEAMDALDEFLNLALDYEKREIPSLQGFVAWLRAARSDVKRDMEMERDEVRVMTVHGAKGLEAPLVILADTTTRPRGPRDPKLLHLPRAGIVWGARQDFDVGDMSAARTTVRTAAEREYRRLLYVALTRAEHRVIVCGLEGGNKRPEGCWYDLVFEALQPLSVEENIGDRKVWRFRKGEPRQPGGAKPQKSAAAAALPPWLTQTVEADAKPMRLISPSDADDADFVPRAGDDANVAATARQRGIVIHRLLQALPDLPSGQREERAQRYLAKAADDWSDSERKTAAKGVLAILSDKRFAAAFAPGSRAEVPIVGMLPGIKVSGQIDRLAVTDSEVLIVDYKTGTPKEQPRAYIRQLALYRALLTKIYPGRTIRAALIWTDASDLVEISAADMDAAMAQLTPA